MDDIAKAMRVIRLRDEYDRYLTAGDDQVSVILTKPKNVGYSLENTKWRVEWVKSPKDLVGQVRLLSVYDKALTFAHDPADYYFKDELGNALTQQPWPPSLGGEAAASEWELELQKRKDDNDVSHQIGFLSKWSKRYGTNLSLNSKSNEYKLRFESFHTSMLFKWLNQYWFFELVQVKSRDNYNGCSTTSIFKEKHINIISPTTSTSTSTSRIGSTIKVTPMKDDTSHDESQKGLNPNTSTCTPPEEQRLMHINHGVIGVKGNNNVGDSSLDQFMKNMFSRCQVGQVYLYMSSTSTRFHTGYKHAQYINTGCNVNGSGDQDNGDVNLSTEINRNRDNEVNKPFSWA